ncbi:MAG: hypothetical protein KKH60_11840 [Proteobacteria bacterium]|nr:hypothetical protein [Pseudomonadota bacterium]MBU1138794.1 hypothetical protein [Pseudomonadota bacterium]
MRKNTLITSACAIGFTGFLLLSATSFNTAAEPGEEEEVSNNLSVPAIFAEGYGLGGFPADSDKGSGLPGSTIPVWGTAYCASGDSREYFLQLDETSSWQAEWSADALDNSNAQPVYVTVDWSDDIIDKVWNNKSVIPIGVALVTDLLPGSMQGYEMTSFAGTPPLCYPLPEDTETSMLISSEEESDEVDEIWGTDGSVYASDMASVYSVCARLTIEKIDGQGGEPVAEPLFSSAVYEGFGVHARPTWYSAMIDGSGKILYLHNWNLAWQQKGGDEDRTGWYRLTFSLDPVATYTTFEGKWKQILRTVDCNTFLLATLHPSDEAGEYKPVYVSASEMYVDIQIIDQQIGE